MVAQLHHADSDGDKDNENGIISFYYCLDMVIET